MQEILTWVLSLGQEDLENPTDRGAWWDTVHRVAKSWTQVKRQHAHTRLKIVYINVMEQLIMKTLLAFRKMWLFFPVNISKRWLVLESL